MKDYSKYFKGPSLKDARSRGRTEVQHLDDAFEIPADMVGNWQRTDILYPDLWMSSE